MIGIFSKLTQKFATRVMSSPSKLLAIYGINKQIDITKQLIAKVLVNQIKTKGILEELSEAEFKIYSQFGDDGIIQYLIHNIKIKKDEENFIEIGVENYREANTRFLLVNNNWRGLIIDARKEYIDSVRKDDIYWKHDLTAVNAFVTRKNINKIIKEKSFEKNVGLISIDIDGNDYWIWKAMRIKPVIVVIEYNSVFGKRSAVTVPYKEKFNRTKEHYSNLFFGTSLKALVNLSKEKGYVFVGTNSAGNNAYFVKKSRVEKVKRMTINNGFVKSRFRESRNKEGDLTYISGDDRLSMIKYKKVHDVEKNRLVKITELTSQKDHE